MTLEGRRALWITAALLLFAVVARGGEEIERGFAAAGDNACLELRIDLNEAGIAELESLPGIGPALAARIEGHRRRKGGFRHIDGLRAVPGIGVVKARALAPFLTVGGEREVSAIGE